LLNYQGILRMSHCQLQVLELTYVGKSALTFSRVPRTAPVQDLGTRNRRPARWALLAAWAAGWSTEQAPNTVTKNTSD